MANQEILTRLDSFLSDPLGHDPAPITRFMLESPNVMVVLDQKYLPTDGLSDEIRPLLMVAFSPGNTQAQLQQGVKENNPLVDLRGLLRAESETLDSLVKRDDAGTLSEYIKAL